jgi:acyl carrier protein
VFIDYLINLLGTVYKVPGTIDPDKSFVDLEVDSLSLAELGAQLEDELGVEVAEEDLSSLTTVSELARLLESRGADIPA